MWLSLYDNVTCNYVPEVDHWDRVVWKYRYFGGNEMHQLFSKLAAGGIFQLFSDLSDFNEIRSKQQSGHNEDHEDEDLGGLSHFWVAFKLWLIFISVSVVVFCAELFLSWFHL
jgi:hypothetical protein